jgi:hypothetical protein
MIPKFQNRYSAYKVALIVAILTIIASACAPKSQDSTTASVESTSAPIESITTPIKPIADEIAKDVGKVMQFNEGTSGQQIIVFEETHDSPAGQVEIAIMMNRLYENYGMRQIALEGYFKQDGQLDASWLPKDSPFAAKQPVRVREDVIAQLLQDGEISSSEAMALIYNDMVVSGIEIPEEYNYELSDSAGSAPIIYLYLIAAPSMTNDEVDKANELLNADKILEGVEYIISTDEWTSKEYALINDDTQIISAEGWLKILDEIEEKASSVGADIPADNKQGISDLRKFYATASQRSITMVDNTLAIAPPNAPIAMVIGAAHTELIVDLLTKQGVSFAVLRSNAFDKNLENGDLSSEAYDRKSQKLSIDQPGTLGALLDGRKKPQPVIGETWFRSKTETYIIADNIARYVAGGGKLPLPDDVIPETGNVSLDKSSIEIKGSVVFFSVKAKDDNDKQITVWVGVQANKESVDTLLEQRLTLGRDNTLEKDVPSSDEESTSTKPKLVDISSESTAAFGSTKAEVEGQW